jgi:hypothetical protein
MATTTSCRQGRRWARAGCAIAKVFFLSLLFFGGDQKFWLSQNLRNLAYFPFKIIQKKIEFKNFLCQNKKKSYLNTTPSIYKYKMF